MVNGKINGKLHNERDYFHFINEVSLRFAPYKIL